MKEIIGEKLLAGSQSAGVCCHLEGRVASKRCQSSSPMSSFAIKG
jgi:hypothetical protein